MLKIMLIQINFKDEHRFLDRLKGIVPIYHSALFYHQRGRVRQHLLFLIGIYVEHCESAQVWWYNIKTSKTSYFGIKQE